MEEQASWKGHSFTLLVFGGIVFLCSIFFVLGMLVGRQQGQRTAESAVVTAAAKAAAAEGRNSSTDVASAIAPYEGVETGKRTTPATESQPEKIDPPVTVTPKTEPKAAPPESQQAAAPVPEPTPVKMIYLQVAALGTDAAAKKEVDELQKQGFTALISGGGPGDFFRVQVGPFSNDEFVEIAKGKLEALGYKPIKK